MQTSRPWLNTLVVIAITLWSLQAQPRGLGLLVGAVYLLWSGFQAGQMLLPGQPRRWQVYFGTIAHLALITIVGALTYWMYRLNGAAISGMLALTPFLWLLTRSGARQKPDIAWPRDPLRGLPRHLGASTMLTLGVLALEYLALTQLLQSATVDAIRTPWQAVAPRFFLTYLVATMGVCALARRADRPGRRLPLVMLHLALTTSVAAIVYHLGYGFDTFIHQATERAIYASGQITPKTPWYIGQYVLVIAISKLLTVPMAWIDRWAAPLGYALIAGAVFFPYRREPKAAAIPLALWLMPLAPFIVTTPQALANGFLILTVIAVTIPGLAPNPKRKARWQLLGFLTAGAALVTHPLAGIFAVTAVLMGRLNPARERHHRSPRLVAQTALALAAALIVTFLLRGVEPLALGPAPGAGFRLQELLAPLVPQLTNRFHPLLDFTHAVGSWRPLLLVGLAVFGTWSLTRRRISLAQPLWMTAAAAAMSAVLVTLLVPFLHLAAAERLFYPVRLLDIAQYALLPLAGVGAAALLVRLEAEPGLRLAAIVLVPAALTAFLYLAYPRADRYQFEHGFNVTAADIAAVSQVARDARGEYLVLANQMTAAAAVRELGFFRYYAAADGSGRQYFAYPIPTGDPLYRHYLQMVNEGPRREIAVAAAELVDAKIRSVYFILDSYWHNFAPLAERAKLTADQWWSVANGKALIFRYDLSVTKLPTPPTTPLASPAENGPYP